uniref:Uncharacterized protein n=1 Tax=Panagrolaimus sp. PS1159 TaxID=55785 RepID=A0AC35G900_9BILA
MVFFYLWVFFGIYGKNGIYFYGFGIIFDGRCLWCSNLSDFLVDLFVSKHEKLKLNGVTKFREFFLLKTSLLKELPSKIQSQSLKKLLMSFFFQKTCPFNANSTFQQNNLSILRTFYHPKFANFCPSLPIFCMNNFKKLFLSTERFHFIRVFINTKISNIQNIYHESIF